MAGQDVCKMQFVARRPTMATTYCPLVCVISDKMCVNKGWVSVVSGFHLAIARWRRWIPAVASFFDLTLSTGAWEVSRDVIIPSF